VRSRDRQETWPLRWVMTAVAVLVLIAVGLAVGAVRSRGSGTKGPACQAVAPLMSRTLVDVAAEKSATTPISPSPLPQDTLGLEDFMQAYPGSIAREVAGVHDPLAGLLVHLHNNDTSYLALDYATIGQRGLAVLQSCGLQIDPPGGAPPTSS